MNGFKLLALAILIGVMCIVIGAFGLGLINMLVQFPLQFALFGLIGISLFKIATKKKTPIE